MISRDEIINEAKKWIGTPFKHQGRVNQVGCDCAGLVVGIAHRLNITNYDYTNYPRTPNYALMKSILDQNLLKIDQGEALPGDIYWIRFKQDPQHLAIKTHHGIIHSYEAATISKVVEHRLSDRWKKRIVAAYRFPGVED